MDSVVKNKLLSKSVKEHLRNVYGAVAMCMLLAAGGAYVHHFTELLHFGLLSYLFSLGLLILLVSTPHDSSNHATSIKRLGYLSGSAFFYGMGTRPLIDWVIGFFTTYGIGNGALIDETVSIEQCIVPTVFVGNSVIFLCFSLTCLLADDLRYLYSIGFLMSALTWTLIFSAMDLVLHSRLICNMCLCGCFVDAAIISSFVIYNTQLIVRKRKMGEDDYFLHCAQLFYFDIVDVFKRWVIILSSKENDKKRKSNTVNKRLVF